MANVSIGAVCFALVGFFTAIIEPIIRWHKPTWRELLLSLLTVCGIVLIFGFDVRYRAGIAVGCLSSLLYAFFSVFSKRVQAYTGRASSTMLLYELYNLEPIYTIVMAMLLFDEAGELSAAFWGGIALILLSVSVQTSLVVRSRDKDRK